MEPPSPNPAETMPLAVKGGRIDGDRQQSNYEALEKENDSFRSFLCSCGLGIPGKGRISKKDTPADLQSSKPSDMS